MHKVVSLLLVLLVAGCVQLPNSGPQPYGQPPQREQIQQSQYSYEPSQSEWPYHRVVDAEEERARAMEWLNQREPHSHDMFVIVTQPRFANEVVAGDILNASGLTIGFAYIQFGLYDAYGRLVGSTYDCVSGWKPNIIWHYSAPVLQDDAVMASCEAFEVQEAW